MKLVNLPLVKWANNSKQLKDTWKVEAQSVKAQTQVLQVSWNAGTTGIEIDTDEYTNKFKNRPTTKRKF